MDNVMPAVEVRSRRIGGATFQIPTPIREDRKIFLMMRWLVTFARKRNGKSMG
jgi:small subunit ribosomal protein S7